jgi:hypothetical protein
MAHLRTLCFAAIALSAGCARVSAPIPARLPVRLLSSEAAAAPRPVPERARDAEKRHDAQAPRIGAPGGSGAGSRRVVPVQSGNETVGGLPAGTGGGAAPVAGAVAGRG